MVRGPLIGRESELLAVEQALSSARLVTITGAGGCGKTRVALEVADRARGRRDSPDAVVVELAMVRAADHVLDAFVRATGARERAGRTPTEILAESLLERARLLVVDNCEHVLAEARGMVAALLSLVPGLHVLATSREPLGLPGEQRFDLSPLGLPDVTGGVAAVIRSDAGRFFVDRASVADPGFSLTPATARAVVRICRRLDGLPLALGFAAAQVRSLSLGEIADGLTRRSRLVVAVDEVGVSQHRSARASLDWSYDLLDELEQALFRRLSVFGGSWNADSAQAIALPEISDIEVRDLLGGLEAKGLIVRVAAESETRWSFLQTVANYAAEYLALDPDEQEIIGDRHLAWFRAYAAALDTMLLASDGGVAIDQETPNLRVALRRAADRDGSVALELVASLLRHWILAEHFDEGRAATTNALGAASTVSHVPGRALVHLGSALLETASEDYAASVVQLQAGLALLSEMEDGEAQARCLQMSGMVLILTGIDLERGLANTERAVEMLRCSDDALGHAWALVNVAMAQGICDRFDAARDAYEEFLTVPHAAEHPRLRTWAELAAAWTELIVGSPERAREHAELGLELEGEWPSMTYFILTGFRVHALALLGRPDDAAALGEQTLVRVRESGTAMAGPAIEMALAITDLMGGRLEAADARARRLLDMPQVHTVALMRETLALIALARADPDEARVHGTELAAVAQRGGSLRHLAVADFIGGRAALLAGDADQGRDLVHAALAAYTELGIERGAADALEELGLLAACNEDAPRAARLIAAAATARRRLDYVPTPSTRQRVQAARAKLLDRDGDALWNRAWSEGQAMALGDAIAYARRSRGPRGRPEAGWPSLTPTEAQAARLAAKGMSNPQIASQLFISRSTVKMHLSNVYLKLGVANRTELATAIVTQAGAPRPAASRPD
ncbi:MAG TPA: LuxR C-terminal-related transcriptional regulator [Solirubrobacteraceae bacterium]|jgi:predicted ATPase/DNA-binding CsgD family transcriptional regulator|nr:LuxR C-terminal-related transcriptional regulator [Solirubrobacteraceae bacterium]